MEFFTYLVNLLLNLDEHLAQLANQFGVATYGVLFLIIFAETGLIITPFLPGDSLLFAIGALSATGALNIKYILISLTAAAILGDSANYWAGSLIGPKVFNKDTGKILNRQHLAKTQAFYEKHGGKTIILARFIPIIRTFAPFVAGVGKMSYPKFLAYNIVGGVIWVNLFTAAGYYFGNLPQVKHNFTIVILAIVAISLLPVVVEFIKQKRGKNGKN